MEGEDRMATATMETVANPWEQIKSRLATKVSSQGYQNWVMRTSFEGMDGGVLRVTVPDQVTKDWMEQEYAEDIRNAIRELNLPVQTVVYAAKPAAAAPLAANGYTEPIFASAVGQLNPKFRFENYVVGSCNQFAHAAARAVANSPSRSYNPLFIYGGVGMGKTHLMHAIGRALLDQYAGMRIVYTSSERFMNEMISSFRSDRMPAFHRHYRSADVLLVDDIQILAGKMAQQILKYLIPGNERRVTMDSVLRAVAERYQLQPAQLKQKTNARNIAYPRQIAMYLIKELTQSSLPEIGRMFGGKHHTTVLHSVHKIENLRQKDADLNRTIHSLIDSIH